MHDGVHHLQINAHRKHPEATGSAQRRDHRCISLCQTRSPKQGTYSEPVTAPAGHRPVQLHTQQPGQQLGLSPQWRPTGPERSAFTQSHRAGESEAACNPKTTDSQAEVTLEFPTSALGLCCRLDVNCALEKPTPPASTPDDLTDPRKCHGNERACFCLFHCAFSLKI